MSTLVALQDSRRTELLPHRSTHPHRELASAVVPPIPALDLRQIAAKAHAAALAKGLV